MRKTWVLCLAILLTACSGSANPSTDGASSSSGIVMRKERPGLEEVTREAEKGDADYQLELGIMYHDGDGAPQDYAKAMEWYRKSAEQGNAMAAFNLGLMYQYGEGTAVNENAARRWFARGAEFGDPKASFQMGLLTYQSGDFAQAFSYFLKSARGASAEGQLNTGLMLYKGEGGAPDPIEAAAWLTLSKENGNARAADLLSKITADLSTEQNAAVTTRAGVLKAEITEAMKK